jgi:hypothetical protein
MGNVSVQFCEKRTRWITLSEVECGKCYKFKEPCNEVIYIADKNPERIVVVSTSVGPTSKLRPEVYLSPFTGYEKLREIRLDSASFNFES